MFLAFLGCDGSGKSAVIAGVEERLRHQGISVTRGHWRPSMKAGGGGASADNPHGQVPRGSFASVLKLGWLGFNWWTGWFRTLRSKASSGVVLFDRYHADILIDPRRYRYGGPMILARLACRLMPQPDQVFFLDADPEILLARKQEVGREALERSRASYLQLIESHKRFKVIDASKPLEVVVDEVCGEIRRMM